MDLTPGLSHCRSRVVPTLCLLLTCWTGLAYGLGLGQIEIRTRLGQPLRAFVPVHLNPGEEIAPACVRVLPAPEGGASLPMVNEARVSLERAGSGARLLVTTPQAVDEPAVRLALEAGCDFPVRREFTLLLDPPVEAWVRGGPLGAPTLSPPSAAEPAAAAIQGSRYVDETIVGAPRAEPPPAVSAPSSEARRTKPAPRRAASAKTDARKAAATTAAEPRKGRTAAQAPRKAKPPASGNRLRLSAEPPLAAVPPAGLRAAPMLGDRPRPALTDAQKRALSAEQARLAGTLRGETSAAGGAATEAALHKRLAEISQEMAVLRQQLDAASRDMQQARRDSVPRTWWWAAVAVAILAVIAALGLALRLRMQQQRAANRPWWANTQFPDLQGAQGHGRMGPDTLGPRPGKSQPAAGARGAAGKGVETTAGSSWIDLKKAVPEVEEHAPEPAPEEAHRSAEPVMRAVQPQAPASSPARVSAPETVTQPMGRAATRSPTPWTPRKEPALARAGQSFSGDTPLVIQRAILQATNIEVQEMHSYADLVRPPTPGSEHKLDLELDLTEEPPAPAPAVEPEPEVSLPPLHFSLGEAPSEAESSPPILPETIGMATARACQHALRLVFKVIAEADVLIEKGEVETATVLLRKFVYDTEDLPPAPWLLLFNLYKRSDKRPIYEALSGRFAKRFGRMMPSWDHAPVGEEGPDISHFPALQESISRSWGEPASLAALYNALMDYTAPDERFFNLPLQRELLHLVNTCPLAEA